MILRISRPCLSGAGTALSRPPTSTAHTLRCYTPTVPAAQSRSQSASPPPNSDATTRPCPSCSSPIAYAASPCPACSVLLPLPSTLSPFALLQYTSPASLTPPPAPPSFDARAELAPLAAHGFALDPKDARGRMLRRQTLLHPDKFASAGERAVDLARTLSGRINEAYAVLGSPLRRAEYILGVYETGISETDSLTDPTLLMEVMEAREELEGASTAEEVDSLRQQNDARIQETVDRLQAAFSQTPPNMEQAKELAVQLKYWYTMEAAAKERHF